jgi:hypothetical protein
MSCMPALVLHIRKVSGSDSETEICHHFHLQQAWSGSWGSRMLRLLDLLDFRHYECGKVVTLTHRPSLPQGVSWYSFLEAESTPGHMVPSVATESPATLLGIDPETLRLVA